MKNHLSFFMLTIFPFALATAQNTFIKSYAQDGEGYCAKETSDGGIIAVGQYTSSQSNLFLWKTDNNGDTVWTRTYGGNFVETGYDVVQTSDGGYFAVGNTMSFGAGGSDVYAVRTDMNGDLLWSKTFGGAGDDYGLSVVPTTGNGFLLAGYTESFGAGNTDIFLIRLNQAGDTLWTKTIGGASYEFVDEIQNTSDGGFIISGTSNGFGVGQNDIVLIKLNANGVIQWSKTFGKYDNEFGGGVQQTPDGGFILAGYMDAGNSKVLLIKTDSSGNQIWVKKYANGMFSNAYRECSSVQLTPDGGYIFTTILDVGNFFIVKTDGNGVLTSRQGFAVGNANSIQPVNGGFIICGTFDISFGSPVLVRTDTLGYSCFYASFFAPTDSDTFIVTNFTPVESFGCTVTSPVTIQGSGVFVEVICSTLGVTEQSANNQLSVFPNPSPGNVTISFENVSNTFLIRVFNSLSEIVLEKKLTAEDNGEINLKNLKPGFYFIQATDETYTTSAKLIVR